MAILAKTSLVIPYLVSSDAERGYLRGFLESIEATRKLLPEVTIETLRFEGVEARTWGDVSKRRAEIIADLPDIYDYLLFLDPDDELYPAGFAAAWKELLAARSDGMLLLELELGQAGTRKWSAHCCKMVLDLTLAKAVSPNTLARGVKDDRHAKYVVHTYELPHTRQVAHLTRLKRRKRL